jgi:hypothetical protein
MTGFASPDRLHLQVFSTSWRFDPPRACRPCFMPDPLLGLRPPELSSSRVAVRRLRRLSPHVVRRDRRACLSDEIRRAPNPNAETMEPVVQRRAPGHRASLPKQRGPLSAARWKSRAPVAAAETPAPFLRDPSTESRVPIPKYRIAFSGTRRAIEPLGPLPKQRASRFDTRSSAPPWNPTQAPSPLPDASRHQTPNPRRRNAEHPSKPRHRSAGTPLHPRRRSAANPPGTRHRGATRSPRPRYRGSADPLSSRAPEAATEAATPFPRPLPSRQSRSRSKLPKQQLRSRDRRQGAGPDRPPRAPNPPCRSMGEPPRDRRRSAGIPLHSRRRNAANPPGTRHRGAASSPSPLRRNDASPPPEDRKSPGRTSPRKLPRLQGFAPRESPPLSASCLGRRRRVALLGLMPSRVFTLATMARPSPSLPSWAFSHRTRAADEPTLQGFTCREMGLSLSRLPTLMGSAAL